MAYTTPGDAVTGEVAPASMWNSGVRDNMETAILHLLVRKTADESVNNGGTGTTLQNDDALVTASITANAVWFLRFCLIFTAANATGDIKCAFTFPSGRIDFTGLWASPSGGNFDTSARISGTASPSNTAPFNGRGTTDRVYLAIEGVFANGATPGAIQLQWAQQTASATNTTVYANSTLWGVKIA